MKITFVLGNGFDIQLGLDTRYSDFLTKYLEAKSDEKENIRKFKLYLQDCKNRELWSNAEEAMGEHLGDFSDSDVAEYFEQIFDFESELINYLESQQNRCSYKDAGKIKTIFKDFLLNSFGDVLNRRNQDLDINATRGQNTFNFITFNYTNLLEKILSCCRGSDKVLQVRQLQSANYHDRCGSVYHVHGTLHSQIIMGVNDESQLDISNGITLTDALRWILIKPQVNRDSRNSWDIPALQTIAESDIIAIYGVSFGKTDKLWWNKIREWLKATTSHKLVVFTRSNGMPTFNPRLPAQELMFERERQIEVMGKLGFSQNDIANSKLLGQVYIISDTKRLELKSILHPPEDQIDPK